MRQATCSRFCVEVREPQELLPGQQKLYSRFCVEVPRASTAPGVDWQLDSTTTDGLMSMVFGSRIKLRVRKWDGNEFYEDIYQIFKSKSIYEQICANLNTWDSWEKVQVCSDHMALCDVVKGESESEKKDHHEFDAECKKAIANAEAERPRESIFLQVRVRDLDPVELVDHPGELSMRDLQKPPEWHSRIFNTRTYPVPV
jgi:hypothetical protein